jgi:hypothetical protein
MGFAQFLASHTPCLNIPPTVFARCVIEHYGFRNLPRTMPAVFLDRAREWAQLRTCHPSCSARDRKLTGMFTGAVPGCGTRHGGTSSALGWSVIAVKPSRRGGGWQGLTVTGFRQKYVKTSFFKLCQKFKKIWKTFLQE